MLLPEAKRTLANAFHQAEQFLAMLLTDRFTQ
jgi:hypothetical protein